MQKHIFVLEIYPIVPYITNFFIYDIHFYVEDSVTSEKVWHM